MRDIGSFFKTLWKGLKLFQSIVGTVLFLVLLAILIRAFFSGPGPNIPDGGALVIDPVGLIVEQKTPKDTWDFIFEEERGVIPETRLRDIAAAIRHAKTDERISTLVINMDYVYGAGLAQLHYIGQLINEFKRTGKPVYAYGIGFSDGQYLVASFADEIYMHPKGSVIFTGYGNYPLYYREAIEKLKAKVHVFRAGNYKSLAEPYTRDDMSVEAREANMVLLNSLWQEFTDQVMKSRGILPADFNAGFETLADELAQTGGDFAALAQFRGLIDGVMTENEWQNFMAQKLGANGSFYGYRAIGMQNYLLATEGERSGFGDEVAVVTVSGEIVLGESDEGLAGAYTVVRHLQTARYDENVKAVVLRIDSPGGGLLASELIREEVELLKNAGKPIIASMGSVAASGGYYIAAPADEIWAQPTTITGSIGVIGMVPTFEGSLDAIGIHADGVGTTPLSGDFVLGRDLSPLAKDILQQGVENSYGQFVEMVAGYRRLPAEEVDAIGQGRVWSGKAANEIGLIDGLGNFDDAIGAASLKADLTGFKVRYIEDQPDLSDQLTRWFFAGTGLAKIKAPARPSLADRLWRDLQRAYKSLSAFNDPNSVYLLCEDCRIR